MSKNQDNFHLMSLPLLLLLLLLLVAIHHVQTQQTNGLCNGKKKMDLTFVLDDSGSVEKINFDNFVKPTVKKIIQTIMQGGSTGAGGGGEKIKVATVVFNSLATLAFNLDTYSGMNDILSAVDRIVYRRGGTHTGDALYLVRNAIVTKTRNSLTEIVPHIVVVITDGNSNGGRAVKTEADLLKKTGALLFAVGVGSSISRLTLEEIASLPEYISNVNNFSQLESLASKLATETCEVADEKILLPRSCAQTKNYSLTLVTGAAASVKDRLLFELVRLLREGTLLKRSILMKAIGGGGVGGGGVGGGGGVNKLTTINKTLSEEVFDNVIQVENHDVLEALLFQGDKINNGGLIEIFVVFLDEKTFSPESIVCNYQRVQTLMKNGAQIIVAANVSADSDNDSSVLLSAAEQYSSSIGDLAAVLKYTAMDSIRAIVRDISAVVCHLSRGG